MMLVDTSIWVDHFNNHASLEAGHLARCISADQPIVLSGIVLTEILAGFRTDADAERVADRLSGFDLAPELLEDDYREAARIYRVCRNRGSTLRSPLDCLIAQTCLRHGYELLARDRDFPAIARHFPLRQVEVRLQIHDRARGG